MRRVCVCVWWWWSLSLLVLVSSSLCVQPCTASVRSALVRRVIDMSMHHRDGAAVTALVSASDVVWSAVTDATPPAARPLLRSALCGAASVALAGPSMCATTAATTTTTTNTTTTTGVRTDMVVWGYASSKFCYAVGVVAAELLLLRCVYRTPHRNNEVNRVNDFFSSAAGWCVLVALLALPQLVCNLGVVLMLTTRLSYDVYVPALVLGRVLQPYVTAAALSCMAHTTLLSSSSWRRQGWLHASSRTSDDASTRAVLTTALLTTLFVALVLYATSRMRNGDDDDNDDDA